MAVLGATGFIGRWVGRLLTSHGARLALLVRDTRRAERIFSRYRVMGEVIEGDLRNPATLQNFFTKSKPVITFNLAGYGVDKSERCADVAYHINSDLVDSICELAAVYQNDEWSGQSIIHAGSAAEYGPNAGSCHEEVIPSPRTVYGQSKCSGTLRLIRACNQSPLRGIAARLFTVYGPGEHEGRLLPSLIKAAASGAPVPLTEGRQKRDFAFVEDVAQGLLYLGLSEQEGGEVVNLATGVLTSVREFVQIAAGVLGISPTRLRFGAHQQHTEELDHDEIKLDRLKDLTGWRPRTSIKSGVYRTSFFQQGPQLMRPEQ